MSANLDPAALAQVPELLEQHKVLQATVALLVQQVAELTRNSEAGIEETVEEYAARTGRNVAAAHKMVQRETKRQAEGKPPHFVIIRNGRAVKLRGAK